MYLKCLACEALARLALPISRESHNTPWTSSYFVWDGTATHQICARVSSLPSTARRMMLNGNYDADRSCLWAVWSGDRWP